MGPHGVSLTVMSGQENGGELVIAASLFLKMPYLSITPVSKNKNVRDEFLQALDVFSYREYAYRSSPEDRWFAQKITAPDDRLAMSSLIWLALDKDGYATAEASLGKKGLSLDQPVYKSIRKLNRIEQDIPPVPPIPADPAFWQHIQGELNRVAGEHQRVKSLKGRRKLFDEHVPASAMEKEVHTWFQSLYNALLPWKQTIYNLQSDMS